MKNSNLKDERIVSQRRKIQSDAYQILVYSLLASIVIQEFVLHAPFAQIAAEIFCLGGMSIYLAIRNLAAGIDIWNSPFFTGKKILLGAVVSGIIFVALIFVIGGEQDTSALLLIFVTYTVSFMVVRSCTQYFNKKRQRQMDEMLSDDDEEE